MNCDKIMDMFQGVSDEFVADAIVSREKAPYRKIRTRKMVLIAAIVALMVMLMGCAVVMGLLDFKLGDRTATVERWNSDLTQNYQETVHQQVLTLSGLKGSDNFKAAKEWFMFLQSYDPDYAIRNQVWGNEPDFPAEYGFYNLYTQEMKEKLDGIISKYGLKLVGSPVESTSTKNLLAYLGIDSVCLTDAPAVMKNASAIYYENGYFQVDFNIQAEGEDTWPYDPMVSYLYSPKDCFDDTVIGLNETDDWQEWNYTTASGENLLVLRSANDWRSWVLCDQGAAMVTLRVETTRELFGDSGVKKIPMTDSQLTQLLDCIDFDIGITPGDPAVLQGQQGGNALSQTSNGYTLEVKSAITDGRTAQIVFGLIVPENVELCKEDCMYSSGFGNFGNYSILSDGVFDYKQWGGAVAETLEACEDGDGKDHTLEIIYTMEVTPDENDPDVVFKPGTDWKIYVQDITLERIEYPNGVYAGIVPLGTVEGEWAYNVTFDDNSDIRVMEFVGEPIAINACFGYDKDGNDLYRNETITSIQLRGFGAEYTAPDAPGALDFANYKTQQFPKVVLKDGTEILLSGGLELQDPDVSFIPLDEVAYLEFIDGTKIYPQA